MANDMIDLDAENAAKAGKQAEKAAAMARAQTAIAERLVSGPAAVAPVEGEKLRAFVAPVEKNTRFLVVAGKPLTVNDPNSPRGKRMYEREGDVWVEFTDGLCVLTPDQTQELAWCESNPEICRDVSDPMTEAWAYMKEMQVPTASQDARLPASINIEAILRGDSSGSQAPHQTVQRARERVS